MSGIIETTLEDGSAQNELTVYQIVAVPETKVVWLRVIGGTNWIQIDLVGFPGDLFCNSNQIRGDSRYLRYIISKG